MAGEPENIGLPIPRALVEFVLLGPADDRRQLQDSPILGDVWLKFAESPLSQLDLLITPHMESTAGRVASAIAKGLAAVRASKPVDRTNSETETDGGPKVDAATRPSIAYLQGIVAARLYFNELLRIVVPLTLWWDEREIRDKFKVEGALDRIQQRVTALLTTWPRSRSPESATPAYFDPIERYATLAGLILWAGKQERPDDTKTNLAYTNSLVDRAISEVNTIAEELAGLFEAITSDWDGGWAAKFFAPRGRTPTAEVSHPVFQVSLNRRAFPAMDKSIPAVKADAARTLFSVECHKITWAVLDSGIDQSHEAFMDQNGGGNGKSRVRKTFDFTRIRDILSRDLDEAAAQERLERLREGTRLGKREARSYLRRLAEDADRERPINWDIVEEFICLEQPPPPRSIHGTHVAGIVGAREVPSKGTVRAAGMCPDIQLYDFRVLAKDLDDTEFAIIAALQFIRYVNELHNFIAIHGANLSLSIPHDVRNYACGRTPLCVECERLVDSGVVVVAAAGNRGYQTFETRDGVFDNYAAFSITDPGNADGVITVGSTHRNWPHTYGVSFFSSRGPTGDGRSKPDLVAPGERIQAPINGGEWALESGTSMAAPHVSGAAAMLMARYAELVGQPRRIKRILCDSATDLGRERSFQGHGMLDVLRAFQSL